ncbi:MAG: PAS domain S-box protein [Halobacteriota archaeon]
MRLNKRPPRGLGPSRLQASWLKGSAFLIFLAAIVLFATVLVARFSHARLTSYFLISVLGGLCFAIALHARYLILLRRDNQKTANTLDITGREFKSIFQNALDGILILDNQGICIEANPAASAILGVEQEQLLGHSLGEFYSNPQSFADNWASFLEKKYQRGSADFVRSDGLPLFVDYTAAADYSPGRHVVILCDVTQKVNAERCLKESEDRFQLMANNIQEVFWMMNANTKEIVYVSEAYEAITGHTLAEIRENPSSYKELVHPQDRARFLTKLEEAGITRTFDEEFRIVRPDGVSRWIWCKGSSAPAFDAGGTPLWLVGIAQDITTRKHAEQEIAKHLAEAEAARAEADALRKATLTLTQNLRMDELLDTLLQTLLTIVPYDSACVLLTDTEQSFLVARQMPRETNRKNVVILEVSHYHFLQKVLMTRNSVLLENTRNESEWRDSPAFGGARSWICIPLVVSENLVGLLSVSSKESGRFTREHLRLAKSLALSAAVAIQNARLYERAEIYASELELQVKLLKETQAALEQTQGRSRGTEH